MLRRIVSRDLDLTGSSGPLGTAARAGAFFARIPYENLTKIVRHRRETRWRARLHTPAEVLAGHLADGTGGTCFALTAALVALLRELGVPCHPALADRRMGADTHCAALVHAAGARWLLDPGFLVAAPVRLPERAPVTVRTPVNDLVVTPAGGDTFRVATADARGERFRYLLKARDVGDAEFLERWVATFDGPTVRAPILTRLDGDAQVYFHGRTLQVIRRGGRESREVPAAEVPGVLARRFGIRRDRVDEALGLLPPR